MTTLSITELVTVGTAVAVAAGEAWAAEGTVFTSPSSLLEHAITDNSETGG